MFGCKRRCLVQKDVCALLISFITKCCCQLSVTHACIIPEVVNSEVRDFDPQKFLNLKEELWRPILEESRAQQAKEEEMRVKLLTEMTLPIYRMRAGEVWEEIKHRLAIEERRQITAALATLSFTMPLDLPLNYDLKTGKIILKSLRENNVLLTSNS